MPLFKEFKWNKAQMINNETFENAKLEKSTSTITSSNPPKKLGRCAEELRGFVNDAIHREEARQKYNLVKFLESVKISVADPKFNTAATKGIFTRSVPETISEIRKILDHDLQSLNLKSLENIHAKVIEVTTAAQSKSFMHRIMRKSSVQTEYLNIIENSKIAISIPPKTKIK